MKILVVEDETAIADFVQRGLEAEGYAVDCAGDGLELLGKIRDEKPTLPVIVLTARDAVEDKVAGLDAGATDYVTKPFSFDELTARIRAHLRGPGQAREVTEVYVGYLRRKLAASGGPARIETLRSVGYRLTDR